MTPEQDHGFETESGKVFIMDRRTLSDSDREMVATWEKLSEKMPNLPPIYF